MYEEDRTRKEITCGIERRKNTFQTLYCARNSTDLSQTVYIFAIYMRYDGDHSNYYCIIPYIVSGNVMDVLYVLTNLILTINLWSSTVIISHFINEKTA